MTSICVCCASRPVFAIHNERIIFFSYKPQGQIFISLLLLTQGQPKLRICVALVALFSALVINFICISNWRPKLIIVTIESTTLTLLLSSIFDATETVSSRSVAEPSFVLNNPSSPRTKLPSGGLNNFRRPMTWIEFGAEQLGILEEVPSFQIVIGVPGGKVIGPPAPSTLKPFCVCQTPFSSSLRLPLRVKPSVPSAFCTTSHPLP